MDNCKGLVNALVLFFLFCNFSAIAQIHEPPKSRPEEQLDTIPNDSSRIRPLFIIANSYLYSDSAKAFRYMKEGLAMAKKYNRQRAVCNFMALWGEILVEQFNFTAAMQVLEEEKALAVRIKDPLMIATGEGVMSAICNQQGDYPGAIRHNMEYLHAGEQGKDTTVIQVGLVNICVAYMNEKNYKKAIEYANQTLLFPFKPERTLSVTKALEMISAAYIEQHNYIPARDSLQRALKLYQDQKNDVGIASIYSVLVQAYPNDIYQELQYALPAQEMWEKLAPNNGYSVSNLGNIAGFYALLARVKSGAAKDSGVLAAYAALGDQQTPAAVALREAAKLDAAALNARSRSYYKLALDRADQTGVFDNIIQLTDSLARMEALDGRYKEAYAYLQRHSFLYDSIYSQENKNKIAGIEADYKVELSDKQLQINKLALSNQIKIKWLLISSLSLALLIIVLVYRQSQVRKRNNRSLSELNEQLEEANKVKTKFFGILNHDLRSPVANLITLLNLHQREPELMDEQSVKARTGQIMESAEELLETMEELLIWSKGQMQQFGPKMKRVEVAELFGDIEKKFGGGGVNLRFEQPAGLSVVTDEQFAMTMLRNLTANAIKALAGQMPAAGEILWKAWEKDGSAWLSITDNGPGATETQLSPLFNEGTSVGIRNGLGLHIVRDMAKAIGCEVQIYSPKAGGLEVRLKMQKN